MKSVAQIISEAREFTNNTSYSATSGISQSLCLKFLNEAQEQLQAAIVNQYPQEFTKEVIISLVGGQEAYSIPSDAFGGNRIISVFYSQTGQERDYFRLPPRTLVERDQRTATNPSFYIRANGVVYLNPIPLTTSATIKIVYYYTLDSLTEVSFNVDISSVANVGLPEITCTTTPAVPSGVYYCNIADRFGRLIFRNCEIAVPPVTSSKINLVAPLNSYRDNLVPSADFDNGLSVITFGSNSTQVPQLPKACERYISTYLQKRMLTKDVANSMISEDVELKEMLSLILSGYAQPTEDVYGIPVLDWSII
jgi:hypothetical protein